MSYKQCILSVELDVVLSCQILSRLQYGIPKRRMSRSPGTRPGLTGEQTKETMIEGIDSQQGSPNGIHSPPVVHVVEMPNLAEMVVSSPLLRKSDQIRPPPTSPFSFTRASFAGSSPVFPRSKHSTSLSSASSLSPSPKASPVRNKVPPTPKRPCRLADHP